MVHEQGMDNMKGRLSETGDRQYDRRNVLHTWELPNKNGMLSIHAIFIDF